MQVNELDKRPLAELTQGYGVDVCPLAEPTQGYGHDACPLGEFMQGKCDRLKGACKFGRQ